MFAPAVGGSQGVVEPRLDAAMSACWSCDLPPGREGDQLDCFYVLDDDEHRDAARVTEVGAREGRLVHVCGQQLRGLSGTAVGEQVGDVEATEAVRDGKHEARVPDGTDVSESNVPEQLPAGCSVDPRRFFELARDG